MQELIARYAKVTTPDLGGQVCAMTGKRQVMHSSIRPIHPDMKLCGPAVTYRSDGMSKYVCDYMTEGCVVVIDAGGETEISFWAGHTAIEAMFKKVAGVVVDGAIRDLKFLQNWGLPTFCKAVTAYDVVASTIHEVNTPVTCGGVVVEPGDIIIGDDNGVVAIPKDVAHDYYQRAEVNSYADDFATRYMIENEVLFTELPFVRESWERKAKGDPSLVHLAFIDWLKKIKKSEYDAFCKWLAEKERYFGTAEEKG